MLQPDGPVAALLTIVPLIGVWAVFLWFPNMRSARTVAFLVTATVAYLWAGVTPGPWPVLIRLGVVAAILLLVFRFDYLVSALPAAVFEFQRSYVAINDRLIAAYREYEETGVREPLEDALIQAKSDLSALPPPGSEWSSLQALAVSLIDERLTMLRTGSERDASAATRFRTRRLEVQNQLWAALDQSRRFWR